MNLLDLFSDNDILIDCSISIMQEASKNGFQGFSGYCGQAAILINECLFDNSQQLFAYFNKALVIKNHHIGHVACLIDLPDGSYFILDSDAELKGIEDIEHWAVLDSEDLDYQHLFDKYKISKTLDNFEKISEMVLNNEFIEQHFNCSHIHEQRTILLKSIDKILPLFISKNNLSKPKI